MALSTTARESGHTVVFASQGRAVHVGSSGFKVEVDLENSQYDSSRSSSK